MHTPYQSGKVPTVGLWQSQEAWDCVNGLGAGVLENSVSGLSGAPMMHMRITPLFS